MTTVIEDFVAKLGWDIDNSKLVAFNRSVHSLDKTMTGVSRKMLGGLKTGFKVAAAGAGILGGAIALVDREYSKIEDAEAAFTPLLKSAGRAKEMVDKLNQTAATTPFQFVQLANATKQLLPNMGGDIDKTIERIRMLGDTAGGNAFKMQSIVRGYNKALLKGKTDMESLNMIAEAGVPIFNELEKTIGLKGQKMFKAISAGKVSTEDLTAALKRMTSEGGIFFRGMEIASGTLSGKLSTLKDNISLAAGELGSTMSPILKALVDTLIKVAQKAKDWISANKDLIRSKIVEYVKKIPYYLEKIKYWVPKIAKLVGVFLAITGAVKALTIATNAFILAKAAIGSVGMITKAINAMGGLITSTNLATKSMAGLGSGVALVATAFAAWQIGKVIHDEIVDPIMAARHEMGLLAGEIADTMGRDVSKRGEAQLGKDIAKVDKYEKDVRGDWLMNWVPGMGIQRDAQLLMLKKERERLKAALPAAHQRANISKYGREYAPVSDYAGMGFGTTSETRTSNTNIAKIENHTHVQGTNASASEIERSTKKGMEKAFRQMKRNASDAD